MAISPGSGNPASPEGRAGSDRVRAARVYLLLLPEASVVIHQAAEARAWCGPLGPGKPRPSPRLVRTHVHARQPHVGVPGTRASCAQNQTPHIFRPSNLLFSLSRHGTPSLPELGPHTGGFPDSSLCLTPPAQSAGRPAAPLLKCLQKSTVSSNLQCHHSIQDTFRHLWIIKTASSPTFFFFFFFFGSLQ